MSRVTAKYQITIPREVRRDLKITPGTEVDIARNGDKYVLVLDPIKQLKKRWRGKFKNSRTTDEYMNEIRGMVS